MRGRATRAVEEGLREEYIDASGVHAVHQLRSKLRRGCDAFRAVHPGQSVLGAGHTTRWVEVWNAHLGSLAYATRVSILWSLGQWFAWLFDQEIIDDNVLEYAACEKLAADLEPELTLHCNLQRHIHRHLDGLTVNSKTLVSYRAVLNRFNVFVNRQSDPPSVREGVVEIGEGVLASWCERICAKYVRTSVCLEVGIVSAFLDSLVAKGLLRRNRLEDLRGTYPCGKRVGVAYALAADDRERSLSALSRQPDYNSALRDEMSAFVTLKHALGHKYTHARTVLREFDAFLVREHVSEPITARLLARWSERRACVSRATQRIAWSVIRQFCVYLHRTHPDTFVPDRVLGLYPRSELAAQIIEPTRMRQILDAVPVVAAGTRWSLRPQTFITLFTLLYTTGLRISEALALRINDVDMRARTLLIRQTKFFKTRLVPFADGLAPILASYLQKRLVAQGPVAPEAPFFVTYQGGHYKKTAPGTVWAAAIRACGLDSRRGAGPRIHDLRHSFASLRLMSWYRDGLDVENRLPLLSTYLGHGSIAATHRYLTLLPEASSAASERFRNYGGWLLAGKEGCHEFT